MATSGSTNFSMNAREVITKALRKALIIRADETASATDAADGLQSLNLMLKTWSTKAHLFITTRQSLALVNAQADYTLTAARRVISARRKTSGVEVPLEVYSRQEYDDTPMKASIGYPQGYYFNPQRSSRTMSLWPVPNAAIAATTTIEITYDRVIEDVDTLDDDLDIPQEWLECIIYNLAARIGSEFGSNSTNPDFQDVKQQAGALLAGLNADDQETASIFFAPGYQ